MGQWSPLARSGLALVQVAQEEQPVAALAQALQEADARLGRLDRHRPRRCAPPCRLRDQPDYHCDAAPWASPPRAHDHLSEKRTHSPERAVTVLHATAPQPDRGLLHRRQPGRPQGQHLVWQAPSRCPARPRCLSRCLRPPLWSQPRCLWERPVEWSPWARQSWYCHATPLPLRPLRH